MSYHWPLKFKLVDYQKLTASQRYQQLIAQQQSLQAQGQGQLGNIVFSQPYINPSTNLTYTVPPSQQLGPVIDTHIVRYCPTWFRAIENVLLNLPPYEYQSVMESLKEIIMKPDLIDELEARKAAHILSNK